LIAVFIYIFFFSSRKKDILDSFSSIYGELTNRLGPKDEEEKSLSDIDVKEINVINEGNENFNITPAFVSLLKYWLSRSRNHRLIRSYIGGLLEELTKNSCDFCGDNWGLRAEFLENLEDLYSNFRLKESSVESRIDIVKWQNYFRANATVRTVCYKCSDEIWERYNHNLAKQKRPMDNPSNIIYEEKMIKQPLEGKDLRRKTTVGSRKSSLFLGLKKTEKEKENQIEEQVDLSKNPEKTNPQSLKFLLNFWLQTVRELKITAKIDVKTDSPGTSSLQSTEHNSNKIESGI
jgi:hypothetical protein